MIELIKPPDPYFPLDRRELKILELVKLMGLIIVHEWIEKVFLTLSIEKEILKPRIIP